MKLETRLGLYNTSSPQIGYSPNIYHEGYFKAWTQLFNTSLSFPFFEGSNKQLYSNVIPYKTVQETVHFKELLKTIVEIIKFQLCVPDPCQYGTLDIQCQIQKNCIFRFISYYIHLFLFAAVLVLLIYGIGKSYGCIAKVCHFLSCIPRFICCVAQILKCLSLGLASHEIVVQVTPTSKVVTQRIRDLKRNLKDIDLRVNFQALDEFQIQRLQEVFQDYTLSTQAQMQQESMFLPTFPNPKEKWKVCGSQ